MAIADDKTRISITLDNKLLERIDDYVGRYGATRSQFLADVVRREFYADDRAAEIMSNKVGEFLHTMAHDDELLKTSADVLARSLTASAVPTV